jgi:hypothetical protein
MFDGLLHDEFKVKRDAVAAKMIRVSRRCGCHHAAFQNAAIVACDGRKTSVIVDTTHVEAT